MVPFLDEQQDENRFLTFYQAHRDSLYFYALSLSSDANVASDLAQEVLTRFLEHYDRFRQLTDDELASYSFRMIHNLWTDYCRREQRHPRVGLEEVSPQEEPCSDDPDEHLIQLINRQLLRQCVRMLSDRDQTAIVSYSINRYSYSAMAAQLQIPEATARQQVSRARRRLKELYHRMETN